MSHVIEKYCEYFSTILFLCHDNKHPMHFTLLLKHFSDTQQKDLVELMRHCGAEVSFKVEDATDYSAIIVDHNDIVKCKAPAFNIKYLEDCLEEGKILNISYYRQEATQHIAKDVCCMDVVYFRTRSWDSVLSNAEKHWFDVNAYPTESDDCSESQTTSNCLEILGLVNFKLGYHGYPGDSKPGGASSTISKTNTLSSDDDSDLEEVVNQANGSKTHERAENIHQTCTIKEEKPNNSKTIKDCSVVLSKALSSKSENGTTINSAKNRNVSSQKDILSIPSTSAASSNKWSFLDEFISETSDEEVLVPPDKKMKIEENKNFFDFEIANEDFPKENNRAKKHTRMPYSFKEQSEILKYIVGHEEYSRVKGRELWMIMERRKVCPNRTWQSMKEHFIKKIVFVLESFDFLTEDNKLKIKRVVF